MPRWEAAELGRRWRRSWARQHSHDQNEPINTTVRGDVQVWNHLPSNLLCVCDRKGPDCLEAPVLRAELSIIPPPSGPSVLRLFHRLNMLKLQLTGCQHVDPAIKEGSDLS